MGGECNTNGVKKKAGRLLVGKRPLSRTRSRWVDNSKIDLGERVCDGMDWTDMTQNKDNWKALVNAVMSLLFP
jgi:hypothetical protein